MLDVRGSKNAKLSENQLKHSLGLIDELTEVGDITEEEYIDVQNEFKNTGENHFIPAEYKPLVRIQLKQIESSIPLQNTDIQNDYNHARNLLYTITETTASAMAQCLQYAQDNDDPKGYLRTYNELTMTMKDLIQDLLNTQKLYKEIMGEIKQADKVVNNTQVNINGDVSSFTGSTADFIRTIKEQEAREKESVINADRINDD